MSRHHYDHIRANEAFHQLVARKNRITWSLSAAMLVVYFSFILLIAFAPGVLGTPVVEGSIITWGIPVGLGVILFAFLITGFYVHKANTIYDGLMQDIVDASEEHVAGMNREGAE